VNFIDQPPFRPDAVQVSDPRHVDHQLGIDRRPTNTAAKRLRCVADRAEVWPVASLARRMTGRDMTVDTEAEKQRSLHLVPTRHRGTVQHV
jgi:hypothetical protein